MKTGLIHPFLILGLISPALTGCGAYRYGTGTSTVAASEIYVDGMDGAGNGLDGSDAPSDGDDGGGDGDGDDSGTGTGTAPLLKEEVRKVGYTTYTFSVPVRKTLKVRFVPGVQDTAVIGTDGKATGFYPQYAHLAVTLQVGDMKQVTALLSNGMSSGSPEKSHAIDFSNAFEKTCAADDKDCRQAVQITVSKPNYDHYCVSYGLYCSPGHTHVWDTHPWNGIVEIQTDDTVAM